MPPVKRTEVSPHKLLKHDDNQLRLTVELERLRIERIRAENDGIFNKQKLEEQLEKNIVARGVNAEKRGASSGPDASEAVGSFLDDVLTSLKRYGRGERVRPYISGVKFQVSLLEKPNEVQTFLASLKDLHGRLEEIVKEDGLNDHKEQQAAPVAARVPRGLVGVVEED